MKSVYRVNLLICLIGVYLAGVASKAALASDKTAVKTVVMTTVATHSKVSILVNLSEQTLVWKNQGGVEKKFSISSGKLTTPTPTGNFKIQSKVKTYTLKEAKQKEGVTVNIPWWMTIDSSRGIAIHGVKNIWGGDYPASGACIRLRIEDAKWLFENTPIGTEVEIIGSEKEYVEKNQVFPWQKDGVKDLLVQRPDGGYGFDKSITPENVSEELRGIIKSLLADRKIGFFRPSPAMIRKDPRFKGVRFANFPNIPELGSPTDQTFDQCMERYFTSKELEAIVGLPLKVHN